MSAGIPYIEDEILHEEPTEEELTTTEEEESAESARFAIDDLENIDTDDTIGLYLKEVSRVPLLNADEEVELAQRIERGRMAREELARGNVSNRRRQELRKLIEDGWQAREHLITANSRLVISVAKKYMGRGVPFLDLIQEGNIGLIARQRNLTTGAVTSSALMPPGGFVRQSPVLLPTRGEPFAFRFTWAIRSISFYASNIS